MTSVDYLRKFADSCISVGGVKAGLTQEAKRLREIAGELEELQGRDRRLSALEAGGVNNWEWFGASLEDAGL